MVVDPRPVAGRRRDDRRIEPLRPDESASRSRSSVPCPDAGRRVVSRSAGVTRMAMGRMIRAGTIRRVSTWSPGSAALPAFRADRRALAAGAAAAVLGRARRPRRGLDQARGPPAARVRWQQAAQPRVPGRRGAGRGRRLPRHVRPALVEPRPADRRGRGEGRAGRPPRAVRARRSDPPNPGVRLDELLGATVHQAATDDRAERAAIVERVEAELRAAGRRPYLVAIGGTGIVGAVGQVLAGLELAERRGEPSVSTPGTVVVPSATGGTQAGLLVGLRTAGLPTGSTASPSTPPEPLRPVIAAIADAARRARRAGRRRRAGDRARWQPSSATATAGRPRRPTTRPALLATDRGDPRRPDLHRQGAGRSHRPGPRRRARRPAGRLLARRRIARPVRAARRLTRLSATPRPTATRRAA